MVAKNMKKVFSLVLSLVFATASSYVASGYQSQSSATSTDTDTGSPTEPAPQSAAELESLVAPIALYPDALVAQILSAATFPEPSGDRRLLAAREQEPDGKRFDAGC